MKDFIEYYEKIKNDKVHIIDIDTTKFIVREITWKEGLLIDAKSFRKKDNIIYQNSEFEKREILKLSILRVYDTKNNVDFISEFESSLLNKIDHVTIEKLWLEFQKYLYLSADEANFYYVSAKKYFNPNHTETFPVPPLLVEIDYMIRGLVSMSKDEFSNISMKEFETIQLILATKNEVKSENAVDLKNFEVEKDL
jgi:predicted transcriptional regulator